MPEYENPNHPAYYDPYNWGDKPPLDKEMLDSEETEDKLDSQWVTESIAKHLGLMGQ